MDGYDSGFNSCSGDNCGSDRDKDQNAPLKDCALFLVWEDLDELVAAVFQIIYTRN